MERVPPLPLMREETMLPDRVEADLWGGSSVTVPLKEPQSIGWSCFPYDSIWQRVWDRVRLLHVPASSNTPFYLLLKITLVTCLAQVIDFGTRNPDVSFASRCATFLPSTPRTKLTFFHSMSRPLLLAS